MFVEPFAPSAPNTHRELSSLSAQKCWRVATMHHLARPLRSGGRHGPRAGRRGARRLERTDAVVPDRVGAAVAHGAASHTSTHQAVGSRRGRRAPAHAKRSLLAPPSPCNSGGVRRERARECCGFVGRSIVVVSVALFWRVDTNADCEAAGHQRRPVRSLLHGHVPPYPQKLVTMGSAPPSGRCARRNEALVRSMVAPRRFGELAPQAAIRGPEFSRLVSFF